jgi:hypothetical protein
VCTFLSAQYFFFFAIFGSSYSDLDYFSGASISSIKSTLESMIHRERKEKKRSKGKHCIYVFDIFRDIDAGIMMVLGNMISCLYSFYFFLFDMVMQPRNSKIKFIQSECYQNWCKWYIRNSWIHLCCLNF